MNHKFLATLLFFLFELNCFSQKLKNGTYVFSIRDSEYVGGPVVAKCKVIIYGERIKVIYIDSSLSRIKYGEVFDEGFLIWHKKAQSWIISHSKKDGHLKELGADSSPRIIDLKKKEIWTY